jgi:uncharacterized membrane protein
VRIAAGLTYLFFPAILFLLVEPYKSHRFVRFHALQSCGFFLAGFLLAALLTLAGTVLGLIPALPLLFLSALIALAAGLLWIVLVVKALQGEILRLPWAGTRVER